MILEYSDPLKKAKYHSFMLDWDNDHSQWKASLSDKRASPTWVDDWKSRLIASWTDDRRAHQSASMKSYWTDDRKLKASLKKTYFSIPDYLQKSSVLFSFLCFDTDLYSTMIS